MPHPPECQDPLATSRLAQGSPEQAGLELGHGELPLLANQHAALLMLIPSKAVGALTELVTGLHSVLSTLQNTFKVAAKSKSEKNKPCDSCDLRRLH